MYLSVQTIKAGIVPSRKNDIPDIMDNPMNTQVRIIHAVRDIRPWMIGTKLCWLQEGHIAGEKDTENNF